MNCKQGDLAIIVGGRFPQFIGNIVKIDRPCIIYTKNWITDPPKFDKGVMVSFYDNHLNPIRDQDGEDEMIRIAGKPVIQELPQTIEIK